MERKRSRRRGSSMNSAGAVPRKSRIDLPNGKLEQVFLQRRIGESPVSRAEWVAVGARPYRYPVTDSYSLFGNPPSSSLFSASWRSVQNIPCASMSSMSIWVSFLQCPHGVSPLRMSSITFPSVIGPALRTSSRNAEHTEKCPDCLDLRSEE